MARVAYLGLWMLCASAAQAARTVLLQPGEGQLFPQAVADFGSTGEDTTIYLPPGRILSLRNVTFVDAVPVDPSYQPFSSGVLTIMPGPGDASGPTVLDAGMRAGISQVAGRPVPFAAELRVYNLKLVNLCDNMIRWRGAEGNITAYTASFFDLFPRIYTKRTQYLTDTDLYIRHADVAQNQMMAMVFEAPFQAFERAFAIVNPYPSNANYSPRMLSTFEGLYGFTFGSTSYNINATLKSLSDPSDTLIASLRAAGLIMQPRVCFDTRGNPDLPMMWDTRAPIAITADTKMWAEAIRTAIQTNSTNLQSTLNAMVPVVVLVSAVQPATYVPSRPLPALPGPLLLAGSFSDQPTVYGWSAILDFTSQNMTVLPISPTGHLHIMLMTLQNLPTQSLPASGTQSVFPLVPFPRAPGSAPISMDRVTIKVSDSDYMALLVLARPELAGCLSSNPVQSHAAALRAGITALQPSTVNTSLASVQLAVFAGWGINASNITITLQNKATLITIGGACIAFPELRAEQQRTRAGLIAVSCVLGVLLLCGTVLGILFLSRRARSLHSSSMLSESDRAGSSDDGDATGGLMKMQAVDTDRPLSIHVAASGFRTDSTGAPFRGLTETQADAPSSVHASRLSLLSALNPTPEQGSQLSTRLSRAGTGPLSAHGGVGNTAGRPLASQDVKDLQSFCGEKSVQPNTATAAADTLLVCLPAGEPVSAQDVSTATHAILSAPHSQLALSVIQEVSSSAEHAFTVSPNALLDAGPESLNIKSVRTGSYDGPSEVLLDSQSAIAKLLTAVRPAELMVEGVLGQGSWGTVYSAVWRGMPVALKTMAFEASVDVGTTDGPARKHQEQALVEAAVAASVDHPNVIRTYSYDIQPIDTHQSAAQSGLVIEDATCGQGRKTQAYKMFLIQELCSASLASVLEQGLLHSGPSKTCQDVVSLLLILVDIARGLEYLHNSNIVQGDLKPENILMKQCEDKGVVCKLADFGLSARLPGDATHVSNYARGTPFYVAPEVVVEHRTSPASDVFSFGVVMWQVQTSSPPYLYDSAGRAQWHPDFPSFQPHNRPAPAYIQIMQRCLLRDPKVRPRIIEVRAALETLYQALASAPARPLQRLQSA